MQFTSTLPCNWCKTCMPRNHPMWWRAHRFLTCFFSMHILFPWKLYGRNITTFTSFSSWCNVTACIFTMLGVWWLRHQQKHLNKQISSVFYLFMYIFHASYGTRYNNILSLSIYLYCSSLATLNRQNWYSSPNWPILCWL